MYNALRGTTDLLGQRLSYFRFIEKKAREILSFYRYEEIITPIFEETSLFSRTIGEDTDVVEKEMYTFSDSKGRSITLRPEGTAPVARAVIEHNLFREKSLLKLFYFGPMFRYERPQAGRQRQFYHLGCEAIGSDDPAVDAEIIVLAWHLFSGLGLKNFSFKLNNIGCEKCRPRFRDILEQYVRCKLEKLCPDCVRRSNRNIFRVLDCKNDSCRAVLDGSPKSMDSLCEKCRIRQGKVENYLKGIPVSYVTDASLVRGLDYYTGTVFEVTHSSLGSQDAIAGGGRYDNLIKELGGPDIPAIGFACGVERLIISMEKEGVLLPEKTLPDAYIIALGEKEKARSFELLTELRMASMNVEMGYGEKSLKSEMRKADKAMARFIIILGEDEFKTTSVTVKTMKDGTQDTILQKELLQYLKERIEVSHQ